VLVAEFSTGVGELPFEDMLLSPNPATDHVRLIDPAIAASAHSWEVISSTGRVVFLGKGPFPLSGIAIGHMENGAYLLRLNSTDKPHRHRFIKIHP